MGFDESRDDPWQGRDGGPHSKGALLRILVECKGVLAGRVDGCEVPYYGVMAHLEELRVEGLAKMNDEQPVAGVNLWLATGAAKSMGKL